MTSEKQITLGTAEFMESPESLAIDSVDSKGIRDIARRFFTCAYEDLGKAPRTLDGDDLAEMLHRHLPRRFAAGDPLGPEAIGVLDALLDHLETTQMVPHAFELRQSLGRHAESFAAIVQNGSAHADGQLVGKGKTFTHQAERTGRNDPCPCGSGKKFKKCCMNLRG